MRRFALLLLIALLAPCAVLARGEESLGLLDKFNQRMDRAHEAIEDVEKALAEPNLSDTALRTLRARIEPLTKEFEETIDTLTPRLAAIQERLKELAPDAKPADKTPDSQKPAEPEKRQEAAKLPPPLPPQRPADKQAQKPAAGKSEASSKSETSKTETSSKSAAGKSDAAKSDAALADAQANQQTQDIAAQASADAERAEQKGLYDGTEATLKRARALLLETRQIIVTIVARQRGLFAKTLFLRTDGLFSPSLWRLARADASADARGAATFLTDRAENFVNRINSGNRLGFFAVVLAILLAIPPALLMARRVARRTDQDDAPTPLRKAAAAAWTTLVVAAVPIAAIGAYGIVFESFDLLDATLEPVWRRIVEAVARVAVVYAIARGVLAPAHSKWRLIDPGDRLARLFVRLVTFAAFILSLTRLAEQLEETVQASVPVVIFTRGVGDVIIAALLAVAVASLPRRGAAAPEDAAVDTPTGRDWLAVTRVIGVCIIVLILGACAAGYVTFANFVILQFGWLAAVIALIYVAVTLLRGGVEAAFAPTSFVGRNLIGGLGVRREQLPPLAVLLAGAVTLIGYVVAVLMAVAPLGFESGDFLANISAAFLSFRIGDVTISPFGVLTALLIFALVLAAAQALRRWLDTRFLPLTRLDVGLRNSISATLGYAGFILAAGLALSHLGLGFEKLAIVAGALSVGIGFGLQSIVNNFVSGLIILWERAIRVGDWVVIGDEQGYVKRINVRSTEIETFDRATMIVPNSNLVAGVVKNWLRGDKVGRIKVALTPHAGVDPEQFREILLAAARAQEGVLRIPAPQVMFLGMDSSSFKFELWCYVEDVEKSQRVRSDLYFDLHRRLTDAGLGVKSAPEPTPTTIVQFPSLDKVAAAAAVSALALEAGVVPAADEKGEPTSEAAQTGDEAMTRADGAR